MNFTESGNFSRRRFLRVAAAGACAGLFGVDRLTAAAEELARSPVASIPVGVQLYSVRDEAAKDLPKVLEAIGKIGYKGVEFAGYYGWEKRPRELRKLLDDNGLKCCGTHTGLETITGDALRATAELHAILGNPYLILPSLSVKDRQGWIDMAKTFNEIAAKAKLLGIQVGYHAHAGDFKRFDGLTSWEIFFDSTNADVLMQLDTGNCLAGGGDPVAILKKYPGRSTTIHLKEHGGPEGAVIGEGDVPWTEVLKICETTGGTAWYIVEHETGKIPLDSIRGCFEGLRKLGRA